MTFIKKNGSQHKMRIAAVVLTYNEELHLARCLQSLEGIVCEVFVVDSFSTDRTVQIAKSYGARVLQHVWINYSIQFNWALAQLELDLDWVLRIDADEVVTPSLASEIRACLPNIDPSVDGIYVGRRMTFQGRMIRHGGVFPTRVLRIFRHGRGHCENRWMDEHIKVFGGTFNLRGEIIDDNRNSLSWWIVKHNSYASREAVDLLNLEYGFMSYDSVGRLFGGESVEVKRWLKEKVYARLPRGGRAFCYFFYRYVIRFGFLDGQAGTAFHFLQGFWYRYLVDAKVGEVKRYILQNNTSVQIAIYDVLGIKV